MICAASCSVLAVTAAACADDGSAAPATVVDDVTATPDTAAATADAATTTTVTATSTTSNSTTTTPTTTPTTTSTTSDSTTVAPAADAWVPFQLDDCECSDGSDVTFFQHDGDPTHVVLYFEGGGACFSLQTCDPSGQPTYTLTSTGSVDGLTGRGGLFDFDNPENPLADYSWVYVPYCTGDVHVGDSSHDYGTGTDGEHVVVEHHGFPNGRAALDHLVAEFTDVEQLVVTGISAGSVPTPLFAGLAADELPGADIVTFGDSSGAYPNVPALNAGIGALWGTFDVVPDWPETADVTPETWSLPGLYVYAGQHAPDVRFGRFDFANDATQATFSGLAGIDASQLVTLIDGTEQEAEDAGVSVSAYVAAGSEHTIMAGDDVYDMETDGVRLIDWISDLVNGATPPPDVHCTTCTVTVRSV